MLPWHVRLLLGKTGIFLIWLLLLIGVACMAVAVFIR
jgi:hypothetical protein